MVRECAALTIVALCPACSLILDFSDSAAPSDGSIDSPFTQAQCMYKEPNDSIATPQMITSADTGPAAICAATPEDHDFYRFTVTNTTTFTVQVTYMNRPSGDLDIKLYDLTGTVLSQSREFTGTETIVCPGSAPMCAMLTAGDYILEVFPAIPGAVNGYTFSITN